MLKEAEAARAASDATVMGLSWWGRVDVGWNGADVELREVGSQACVTERREGEGVAVPFDRQQTQAATQRERSQPSAASQQQKQESFEPLRPTWFKTNRLGRVATL